MCVFGVSIRFAACGIGFCLLWMRLTGMCMHISRWCCSVKLAQLVLRSVCMLKVEGSIPAACTLFSSWYIKKSKLICLLCMHALVLRCHACVRV